jgi:CNT family concentrative nucleoside transporter
MTYALCGFANVASIGVQLGCLGVIAPGRKRDLSELAMSAMLTGTVSTWLTAAVAGTIL